MAFLKTARHRGVCGDCKYFQEDSTLSKTGTCTHLAMGGRKVTADSQPLCPSGSYYVSRDDHETAGR